MELYFLDENFSHISGPVDFFTSVVWSERYFEVGTFTLHFPRVHLPEVLEAVYVSTSAAEGEIKCGRIDYIITGEDGDCEIGGRMLESLLSDRVIYGSETLCGNIDEIVAYVVERNMRDFDFIIGESESVGGDTTVMYDWDDLAEWLYSILRPFGASFTVKLDPESGKPVFRVVNGKNRTVESSLETGIEPAIFSSSFENVSSIDIETESGGMKNFVYVEGKDGTVVTVDQSEGIRIREMYYSAKDIAPTAYLTAELYQEALAARGRSVLSKYKKSLSVSAECDVTALPRYGADYALGDICDVADSETGLSFELRVSGVDTVWENGSVTVFPLFGEERDYIGKLKNQLKLQ
ncbi:MAG: hypothetical protein E7628_03410 [Ruminococcaceae bacterium]|nr:hypothetical protein [Oscillospiraceae bacterium]